MKQRTIEKLLYKIAALLVVSGAVIRILHLSDNYLGLYLMLAGHILGIIAIFMYMKYVNNLEQKNKHLEERLEQVSRK
ncbi:MAG: hypothetical protein LPK07_06800 [Hymenobacteraceae bacterium]|nr:hypothetical protein [Hymenobacteraceae bacterium]MDX5481374.1 hypothetical protein [Hymenobacteraceae bacterium]